MAEARLLPPVERQEIWAAGVTYLRAVLLTGTGIVPPDNFTLCPDDTVRIECDGIGVLQNSVQDV